MWPSLGIRNDNVMLTLLINYKNVKIIHYNNNNNRMTMPWLRYCVCGCCCYVNIIFVVHCDFVNILRIHEFSLVLQQVFSTFSVMFTTSSSSPSSQEEKTPLCLPHLTWFTCNSHRAQQEQGQHQLTFHTFRVKWYSRTMNTGGSEMRRPP